MSKIEIKKRASEEVVCWRVNADSVTPNTVIQNDSNLTILVKVDGVTRVQMKESATVHSLFNPGKNTKLVGGNKPYDRAEIYVLDQSTEFNAEWGLAGNNAMKCIDRENEVECNAIAFGEYCYKIENFVSFFQFAKLDEKGELTRGDIRELLRSEASGVIKAYLSRALMISGMEACQAKLGMFEGDTKDEVNRYLAPKGLTVSRLTVNRLSYDKDHEKVREEIKEAKLNLRLKKIVNEGELDDIRVKKAHSEIDIEYIKAMNGSGNSESEGKQSEEASGEKDVKIVFCPTCGEKNINTLFCKNCGTKLPK